MYFLILVFIYLFNKYSLGIYSRADPLLCVLYLGDEKMNTTDQIFYIMMLFLVQEINNSQVKMQIRI